MVMHNMFVAMHVEFLYSVTLSVDIFDKIEDNKKLNTSLLYICQNIC